MTKVKLVGGLRGDFDDGVYLEIPKTALHYLKWNEGDTIELDIPTTGSDMVLNKVKAKNG